MPICEVCHHRCPEDSRCFRCGSDAMIPGDRLCYICDADRRAFDAVKAKGE